MSCCKLLLRLSLEKKKIYKSNTHVLLNDEVDFFLCSKWKITENAYNSQIFF